MLRFVPVVAATLAVLSTLAGAVAAALVYPAAPTADQVDDYHGVKVADPFRPLENLEDPRTRGWIDREVKLTAGYLDAIPARDVFRARLRAVVNYERHGVPTWYGDRYIYSKNSGLQNQAVWYQSPSLDAPGTVLLDPNALSKDGTVAVGGLQSTRDGKLVAYSIQRAGSDWQEWHVRRTSDATDLPDKLEWSKFSGVSWLPDDSGFYYCRFAEPDPKEKFKDVNVDQQVYFHRIGTAQSADTLVYRRTDDPHVFFGTEVTDDGRYLVVTEAKGFSKYGVVYRDLQDPSGAFVRLFEPDAAWGFVHAVGARWYFSTDKDAPRGKVVAVDVHAPATIETVVPEGPDAVQSADVIGGKLVVSYSHNVAARIQVLDLSGKPVRTVALPGLGSASVAGRYDRSEAFVTYTDYVTPSSILRYDMETGASAPYFKPAIPFDSNAYQSEQVFVTSRDGTRIPMFVVSRKGLVRDGHAPAILTGYGGFDVPINPAFSSFNAPWLDAGGILAVVNLRGGSEYGEAWHRGGMLEHKQNVFDDFLAAAHWLVEKKYTSAKKLAAMGGSNGGLLIGAAITQSPSSFGAAIVQVGVLDMLRYQHWTIGSAWVPEYGSSDDAAQFRTLYAYSPLHRLHKGTAYPATLIMTSDHDDRVFPAHSFKFAAAMQRDQGGPAPVLIRIETQSGHGGGTPLAKSIDAYGDLYAFLAKNLGVAVPGK